MRKIKRFLMGFFFVLCLAAAVQAGETVSAEEEAGTSASHEFTEFSYAKDYLKQQMIMRQEKITFTLVMSEPNGENLMKELIQAATETSSASKGREGDYLDIHVEQYRTSCTSTPIYDSAGSIKSYEHQMTFLIHYYTTWDQEKEMSIRISQVLSDLNISDKSTYEKVSAIYDYVCKNVQYDSDAANEGRFSAYNALVKRKAVCQGYAALMYRLLRDAGIECRIIKGTGKGVAHSWNIVKLGNYYYNLDATWDAGKDPDDYRYFLKTEAEFRNHVREAAYNTAAFHASYPMSAESYCFGNHTWASDYTVDVAPTCTDYGVKSIHCVKCDEVKEGSLKQIDMTEHTYGSWAVTREATVFKKGIKKRVCAVCGKTQKSYLKKVTPTVTLNAASTKMKTGQKSTALAVAKMGNGDSVKKWTSSDPSVVSVGRKTGKLTAKKKGTATITVTLTSGVKASCKVKVVSANVKAKSIAFEKKRQTMQVGDTLELKIVANPITATDKITYTVSNNGVLSVENGVVTAEQAGTAYVKASTSRGITAKCKIKVQE